uniref:hypothetical protein n=1 Tax=Escherichia coli TaxID=562 RepID=UPI001430FA7A|nr:hypothetical protein [Escherichia coli]
MTEEQKRIERAIELACRYGGTDEMHHLLWVVDQMVRELAGERALLQIVGGDKLIIPFC